MGRLDFQVADIRRDEIESRHCRARRKAPGVEWLTTLTASSLARSFAPAAKAGMAESRQNRAKAKAKKAHGKIRSETLRAFKPAAARRQAVARRARDIGGFRRGFGATSRKKLVLAALKHYVGRTRCRAQQGVFPSDGGYFGSFSFAGRLRRRCGRARGGGIARGAARSSCAKGAARCWFFAAENLDRPPPRRWRRWRRDKPT